MAKPAWQLKAKRKAARRLSKVRAKARAKAEAKKGPKADRPFRDALAKGVSHCNIALTQLLKSKRKNKLRGDFYRVCVR